MAELLSLAHPCSLQASACCFTLRRSSSTLLTTFAIFSSSSLSRKNPALRTRTCCDHHVTSLDPPPANCFSSDSRVTSCLRLARGRDGQQRSFRKSRFFRVSSSSSSRRDGGWEGAISFNSRAEPTAEERGLGTWAQSMQHVEPAIRPQIELGSVQQDVGMACVVLVGAFVWVRLFDFFTSKHLLGQKLSRKIVHITSGLLYMLCWPFFSTSKWAPFIAGLVPLANGIRLLIYGFEILKDEGLVKSMSRSGESRELLRGPLFYVMVLYLSTIFFWRQSPVGMIALSMMCGGDDIADIMGRKFGSKKLPYNSSKSFAGSIADIMGRKFGSKKLPYNSSKSFAGSIAMFLFGFLVSSMCVYYFTLFGFFELDLYSTAIRLTLISFVATVVESLPITTKLDDNFTVPATSFLLGIVLFP